MAAVCRYVRIWVVCEVSNHVFGEKRSPNSSNKSKRGRCFEIAVPARVSEPLLARRGALDPFSHTATAGSPTKNSEGLWAPGCPFGQVPFVHVPEAGIRPGSD